MNLKIDWATVVKYDGIRDNINQNKIVFTIWFIPSFNPEYIIPNLKEMGLGGVDMIQNENAISISLLKGSRVLIEESSIIIQVDN